MNNSAHRHREPHKAGKSKHVEIVNSLLGVCRIAHSMQQGICQALPKPAHPMSHNVTVKAWTTCSRNRQHWRNKSLPNYIQNGSVVLAPTTNTNSLSTTLTSEGPEHLTFIAKRAACSITDRKRVTCGPPVTTGSAPVGPTLALMLANRATHPINTYQHSEA